MLGQTGEYLTFSDQHLKLQPALAESWKPNAKADVWTFKIRQGVKFHNGAPLTADDVVYTYKLQTDPKGASSALSALGGVLTPDGVVKKDDFTVEFHLEGANGNFPYLTSSDNYTMIILPNNYDPGKWESTLHRHWPVRAEELHRQAGRLVHPQRDYWGSKALPAATEFTFYDQQTPQILALTGGQIDVVGQFSVSGGEQLLNGSYNVIKLKSSAHRELSMRNDKAPFNDARVRRAIALTLNRPQIVTALFKGLVRPGQRQPVRAGVPVHRHVDRAAHAEHRRGQVAAVRGRPCRTASPCS